MSNEQKDNLMICGVSHMPQDLRQKYPQIQNSEPLWKRAPTRDVGGKPYADFMMLIPGLRDFEASHIRDIINKMENILKHYEKDIVLADLNLKINVLWVTLQPRLGLSTEIASMIHHLIPEAKLVSQHTVESNA